LALVLIALTQAGAKVDNKISCGVEAEPGELPFMVSLFEIGEDGIAQHGCGGSIIDAHHILTAAHCVDP
jgi:secreted trypsin-like serine protease